MAVVTAEACARCCFIEVEGFGCVLSCPVSVCVSAPRMCHMYTVSSYITPFVNHTAGFYGESRSMFYMCSCVSVTLRALCCAVGVVCCGGGGVCVRFRSCLCPCREPPGSRARRPNSRLEKDIEIETERKRETKDDDDEEKLEEEDQEMRKRKSKRNTKI